MNLHDESEPRYVISIAARMVGVHVQTLRYYERAGLIKPSRSGGNMRFYSAKDVAHLQRIRSLIEDLGVNLAGVDVIMRMSKRMLDMQNELNAVKEELNRLMTGSRGLGDRSGRKTDGRDSGGEEWE